MRYMTESELAQHAADLGQSGFHFLCSISPGLSVGIVPSAIVPSMPKVPNDDAEGKFVDWIAFDID